jgi:hypothetical protein
MHAFPSAFRVGPYIPYLLLRIVICMPLYTCLDSCLAHGFMGRPIVIVIGKTCSSTVDVMIDMTSYRSIHQPASNSLDPPRLPELAKHAPSPSTRQKQVHPLLQRDTDGAHRRRIEHMRAWLRQWFRV